MNSPGSGQLNLDFSSSAGQDGITVWRQQRAETLRSLAHKMGLPLGHPVEVRLRDGVLLRGLLRLREELLIIHDERNLELELTVDGVCFKATELEACVRLD